VGIGFGLARYRRNALVKVFLISGGLLLAMAGHFIHNAAATLAVATDGVSILLALLNYGVLVLVMALLWLVAAGAVPPSPLATHPPGLAESHPRSPQVCHLAWPGSGLRCC
jgi:hypothetical protein